MGLFLCLHASYGPTRKGYPFRVKYYFSYGLWLYLFVESEVTRTHIVCRPFHLVPS